MPNTKKTDDNICGVNCTVTNCTYHAPDDSCHAHCIKVENRSATKPNETNCSTFELKR